MNNVDWEAHTLQSWISFHDAIFSQPHSLESWQVLRQFYVNLHPLGRQYIDYIFNGETFMINPDEVLDHINYLARYANYHSNNAHQSQPPPSTQTEMSVNNNTILENSYDHLNELKQDLENSLTIISSYCVKSNFENSSIYNSQPLAEIGHHIEHTLNYNLEDSLEPIDNTFEKPSPIVGGNNVVRRINELGEDVLCFYFNHESRVNSINSGCDNDNSIHIENFDKETSPSIESIPVSHIPLPFYPTTPPITNSEFNGEDISLKQFELDRLGLQNEELKSEELERSKFTLETPISSQEVFVKSDQFINDSTYSSDFVISSSNNYDDGKIELVKNNTLSNHGEGALIIDDIFCEVVEKIVKYPFIGDVIDFVIPIFHPRVDPTILLNHANQFSCFSYVFDLTYIRFKKSKHWLEKFPYWVEFGSIEFMPVSSSVTSFLLCIEVSLWCT